MGGSADRSMLRQWAAKGGLGLGREPGRARLKLMHQEVHKVLSAHLFFGAFCRNMWCTGMMGFADFIGNFWCMRTSCDT